MNKEEFKQIRQYLRKTQAQLAHLLVTSLKGVQSFEQGWRNIPAHIERQMLFLIAMKESQHKMDIPCWKAKQCPAEMRQNCPAWDLQIRCLCWIVNGTISHGDVQDKWDDKMEKCRKCDIFKSTIPFILKPDS